jgi:hypothetical protein
VQFGQRHFEAEEIFMNHIFRNLRSAIIALIVIGLLVVDNNDLGAAEKTGGQTTVDFAREVLPILSNKCFVCHGPDSTEDDQLRLDTFEGATQVRRGYQAINPKSPEQSELLARINSSEEPMPPADAEKQLTPTERDVLTRWAMQGGEYAMHWAFVSPENIAPTVSDSSIRNEVDAFLLQEMQKKKVAFAPEADRMILARRAALILTGLPPEPEQLHQFLNDESGDAYEKFVDELLKSPRYGEHQARYWLDAVRYGDTHGLHLDNRRGIYPYRDWVVFALNSNLPLDDFITWQLAGDLLHDPSIDQLVATGYVRLNPTTGEGEEQLRSSGDAGNGIPGDVVDVCPLPHTQVRSDSSDRVLPAAGILQQYRRAVDGRQQVRIRSNGEGAE